QNFFPRASPLESAAVGPAPDRAREVAATVRHAPRLRPHPPAPGAGPRLRAGQRLVERVVRAPTPERGQDRSVRVRHGADRQRAHPALDPLLSRRGAVHPVRRRVGVPGSLGGRGQVAQGAAHGSRRAGRDRCVRSRAGSRAGLRVAQRRTRMGSLRPADTHSSSYEGFLATRIDALVNWGRKNSLWPMPLGLSCCGIELMAMIGPKFDISRFGAEAARFSPRQCDLLIVAGTLTWKMAEATRVIYDQMPDPKWVIAMGV